MVSTLKSVHKRLFGTILIKATEQYCPVILFIMLYNVAVSLESVDEILKCDHSKLLRLVSVTGGNYNVFHCTSQSAV